MNNLYYPSYQTCKVPEVNGMNGANAYQIGVNSSVLLLDTNLPIVYLKQTDGGGYATVTAFDLVAHKDAETRNMEDIKSRLDRLEELINEQALRILRLFGNNTTSSTDNAVVQNERDVTRAVGSSNGTAKRN